jgi:hypothetical protein
MRDCITVLFIDILIIIVMAIGTKEMQKCFDGIQIFVCYTLFVCHYSFNSLFISLYLCQSTLFLQYGPALQRKENKEVCIPIIGSNMTA